ncbi:MAG: carboxypeptidase-like regulatory domain-containing protein [Flavobacteriales bacterium]|nr:carboxypeptidase-like regulatory domain-containing protein [Flavobacteriales bacterium]
MRQFLTTTRTSILTVTLIFGITNLSFATLLKINGKVQDEQDPISNCEIFVEYASSVVHRDKSNQDGSYSLDLEVIPGTYTINFASEGYATKKIEIDANTIRKSKDYTIENVYLDLFVSDGSLNTTALNKPVARLKYDLTDDKFVYDEKYNVAIQRNFNTLWNKVRNQRVHRNEIYENQMIIGDSGLANKDWSVAKTAYLNALVQRPMAIEPKEKLKRILNLKKPTRRTIEKNFLKEIVVKGKKRITIYRSKKDESIVFHKVDGRYNQQFYFINNVSTTKLIWEQNVRRLENSVWF